MQGSTHLTHYTLLEPCLCTEPFKLRLSLSSGYGTYKTVKARLWPSTGPFSGESPGNLVRCSTKLISGPRDGVPGTHGECAGHTGMGLPDARVCVFDTRGSVISLPRELSDVFGGERGQHTVECAERERERIV